MQNKQWFLDRVGKTVYRDCLFPDAVGRQYTETRIKDELQAIYMFDVQNDLMADNKIDLNYRDTKEK